MEYLVSVVITTYNRPVEVLERALKSVVSQDYKDYELIVVNDAPNNSANKEIEAVVKSHGGLYHQNERSLGANGARNQGVRSTKGDIIAFLDDDDEWLPNKLSSMLPSFDDRQVGLVYCDMIIKCNENESISTLPEYQGENIIRNLLLRNYIGGFSGPLIRRKSFDECGGLDESLLSSQDNDFWRRIALQYNVIHVKEPLIKYYINPESITSNSTKRIKGTAALIKKYEWLYKSYPDIRERHINLCVQNYIQAGWNAEAYDFYRQFYSFFERLKNSYVFPLGYAKKIVKKIINRK